MNRDKLKTLHLVLKRKWYDMIASGEKTEEYRAITPYWCNRFIMGYWMGAPVPQDYDFVCFHKGYTKETMTFEELKLTLGKGRPEWGAPVDEEVFVIKLGNRIN